MPVTEKNVKLKREDLEALSSEYGLFIAQGLRFDLPAISTTTSLCAVVENHWFNSAELLVRCPHDLLAVIAYAVEQSDKVQALSGEVKASKAKMKTDSRKALEYGVDERQRLKAKVKELEGKLAELESNSEEGPQDTIPLDGHPG